jgi:hypothetical protein
VPKIDKNFLGIINDPFMLVVFCLDILTSLCPSVATKSTLLSKKLKHAPFKAGLVGSLFIAYNRY